MSTKPAFKSDLGIFSEVADLASKRESVEEIK